MIFMILPKMAKILVLKNPERKFLESSQHLTGTFWVRVRVKF